MAANTRPYFIIFNGVSRMVEAPNPAAAVRHVAGAAVTELRPARGAEVANWVRGNKAIEVAGEKIVDAEAGATMPELRGGDAQYVVADDAASYPGKNEVDRSLDALKLFQDWAGYDPKAKANTQTSADTVSMFTGMHASGQLDLMTFDLLRQRAPEFGDALVAAEAGVPRTDDETYVAAVLAATESGLASLRSRLEEQPMPAVDVVRAIVTHAGQA